MVLGEIGKGEIVGEMAALMGSPRNATIVALRNSVLLLITAPQLVDLLQREKESLVHLAATIARRSDRSYRMRSQAGSIALVGVTPGLDLGEFASKLLSEVQRFASSHLLSPAILQQEKGVDPEDETSIDPKVLNGLLAGYEEEHALLLYIAGEKWSEWTQCIAGRADKVILVAEAGNSPEPGALERRLREVP